MLIDFFYTLRAAKLPVSVKEYLTLLEALEAGVVGPRSEDAWSLDDFYFMARTALVKDEKHFDKFDRAFAAYFKGVEMIADFTKDVPLEWLRKNLELELSPEEKAKIEKMGWDELMETLKKRFEEDPVTVIIVASLAVTAAAKLIDSLSAAQGRRAYAQQVNYRTKM